MSKVNEALVERVLARVSQDRAFLDRFLEQPGSAVAELAGGPVDEATLEAIGQRLQERLTGAESSELSDAELDAVAGGLFRSAIARLSPTLGRTGTFTSQITYTF